MIYVNDGSGDQSLSILTRLHEEHPKTVVVADLSRNWGHQQAISAGLSLAQGDAVIIMDGDFQDPPSLIPEMVAAWKQGAEVVIAHRTRRSEHGLRRILFPLFYRLLGYMSDYPIPLSVGIFGLVDRKVCNVLANLQETNRFLPGLRSWVGFRTVVRQLRPAGSGARQTQANSSKPVQIRIRRDSQLQLQATATRTRLRPHHGGLRQPRRPHAGSHANLPSGHFSR